MKGTLLMGALLIYSATGQSREIKSQTKKTRCTYAVVLLLVNFPFRDKQQTFAVDPDQTFMFTCNVITKL